MKRPSFQFYPADWRKDAALQSCSISAQGLWINIMCIAHECEPYGHLTINEKPMTAAQIGRLVGLSAKECQALIDELSDAGVLSFSDEGAIFSRRMVKDEELRNVRAAGGKAGSLHGSKGAEHGSKGGRPSKSRGDKKPPLLDAKEPPLDLPFDDETEPPLKPPPSSSSSSSSSEYTPLSPENGGDGWELPDWVPSELWDEFEALRKKRKKPMTDRARGLAVNKLASLLNEGHQVDAVMEQTILHSWDTFYPIKGDFAGNDQFGGLV